MVTARQPRGGDVHLRGAAQMLEYIAIADRIAADGPGRILDWGCGFGQVSDLLLARGLDVRAMDYRPSEPAGRRPLERFPHIMVDVTDDPVALPYADESFDAVLSLGVLEHVRDPDASLHELARVLRPRGTLYVYKLPNRFSYLEWIARRAGLYYHGQYPDDVVYDRRSARELLERNGFVVSELRHANMLPLTIDHPLAARLSRPLWTANRVLARAPGVSVLATNVELVATR
jgi:SAM-dependent methyltransferase